MIHQVVGVPGAASQSVSREVNLSIVIVSWNVAGPLEACLTSIITNLSGLPFEIIVVDNASSDHTTDMLREKFPRVKVIANRTNVGFARANNQALSCVSGRFVLMLNPDTVLVDTSVDKMIQFMIAHPDVGMVGPRVTYPNGDVQNTCARPLPTLTAVFVCEILAVYKVPVVGHWLSRIFYPYDYSVSQEVEAISGAAMLVRRDVLDAIGGFGETFIHAGEDVDFCFRVRKAGWKIHYVCDARVVHMSGQSSRQAPVRTTVNVALSEQQYFIRCFGVRHGLLFRVLACVFQAPRIAIMGCVRIAMGRESYAGFKQRLAIAKSIWLWRALE